MTRVLVTGGSGFIGRQVLPALAASGADVHVSSRAARQSSAGVTWHRADILDPRHLNALVNDVRPEILLHLAWFATPPDYWRSPVNVRWAAASLELAQTLVAAGGRRLVGVGTCAEYQWSGSSLCVENATPIRPATLYGGCKAAVWSALEPFAREASVEAAWARLFFVYGPNEPANRLVPSLVTAMRAGNRGHCRTARHVRDFLHVADAGSAIAALTMSGVTGPVNIGSGQPVEVGTLATGIAERVGRPELLTMEDGPQTDAFVVANVDRLRTEVGWRPRFSLDDGLDDAVRWWSAVNSQLPTPNSQLGFSEATG
jgi:nucleoside-diphosphate-sugar epimerase